MSQLTVGSVAPQYALVDHKGVERSTEGAHRTILFFYPAAFTPGCTGEVCDFRDRTDQLQAAGYQVYGVSPDSVDKLAEFAAEFDVDYPLLADPDHAVAESFGAWGIKKNYGKEYVGLIRSTIVIGVDGIIEAAWYNVRAKGHAERVTRELLG